VTDQRPKSVEQPDPFRLAYLILQSGECVLGLNGGPSFGVYTSAAGAAWFLRRFADAIERDGEERNKTALDVSK